MRQTIEPTYKYKVELNYTNNIKPCDESPNKMSHPYRSIDSRDKIYYSDGLAFPLNPILHSLYTVLNLRYCFL